MNHLNQPVVDVARIGKIFFPYVGERTDIVKRDGTRFVHYTTAEAAVNILRNREIWMRNATTMSDFMEVEHGFQCLNYAYKGEPGAAFKQVIESAFPGTTAELEARFNAWLPGIRSDTYLTCVSEHLDSEDTFGRLSMWRAYGRSIGVALVLNPDVFWSDSNALKVYSSPVAYVNADEYSKYFLRVAEAIRGDLEYVRSLGKQSVFGIAFWMLRLAVICTKHPGFQEEREWRVVHSPTMDASDRLIREVQTVRGVPQNILKIPLRDIPDEGLIGTDLAKLLNRIIIGPTQFPQATYQAFHKILTDAEVPEPEKKIYISDIPLR